LLVRRAQLALGPRSLGDVEGDHQSCGDALHLDLPRDDLDVEDGPVLLAVPPHPVGTAAVDRHDELLDVLLGPDVRQRERHELLAGVAVVGDGGVVDREEPQGGRLVDPHGHRVLVEQRPVPVVGEPKGLLGRRREGHGFG
jgi:hypothetical protein